MQIWKSHETQSKPNPSNPSVDRRSTLPLSSTVWIAAISTVVVFGLFCYTVQAFSRGEIRLEGLGIRFEALIDSYPKQDKAPLPNERN